jgi:hypothetical protein
MLQCAGLEPEQLLTDLFLDPSLDPASPNPAPPQQANYHVQLHAKQVLLGNAAASGPICE